MTCTQPGCTGNILDGYCDFCGMAAATGVSAGSTTGDGSTTSPAATPASAIPTATAGTPATGTVPAPDGSTCGQPGCTGNILDGYCNVCGAPATAPASQAEPIGDATGSVATSASRVQSAAIGSARIGGSTAATRRTRTGSRRMRTARLGAGLTKVPPAPPVDPAGAIMPNPSVPESRRNCSRCQAEVGRSDDGRPGRSEGFCPQCGHPYSFTPKLQPGDIVANQYEVAGALAHGGLGWIYLARDRNVSNRWVVLKGLLNTGDADALAAAIAEQQFLAQVEHPTIVEIFNIVQHEGEGYTVMEYVGGRSLKQVLKERMAANNGVYDPLPVDQALAYILEILPAFSYLHDKGLVYCDFKPDNMIQVGDGMKLIDLGGVRRIDDEEGAIYGTVGYQAPEIAELGPSVASDIYTIGRTLLVLTMEFRGYQGTYLHSLPPVDQTPLFAEQDSLYWLVAKCCAPDPADRFASVDELRTQVLGVLREVVSRERGGTAQTAASSMLFHAPETARALDEAGQLPRLKPDTSDPQWSWLSMVAPDDPERRLQVLESAPESTPEVWLARAHAALELGRVHLARDHAQRLLADDPWEWRALWVDGLAAVEVGDWNAAKAAFNAVHQQVPGELAPKLALAFACEHGGLPQVAEGLYLTCIATDATYVAPAAFGVARVRAERGDTAGATAALDLVPQTSRGYTESRRQRAEVLLAGDGRDLTTLDEAMRTIDKAAVDNRQRNQFAVRILDQALELVTSGSVSAPDARIGDHPATEPGIRSGMEAALRALARDSSDLTERVGLVNRANAVRPWSMT